VAVDVSSADGRLRRLIDVGFDCFDSLPLPTQTEEEQDVKAVAELISAKDMQ